MNIILWTVLGALAVGTAVTVLAIVRARDGVEDEEGFHFSEPLGATAAPERKASLTGAIESGSASVPEALAASAGMGSGLVGAR